MDFDPRDHDSRDDERFEIEGSRGGRGASDEDNRDDDWRQPETRSGDRDDQARELGRGPGSDNRNDDAADGLRDRDDARWPNRDHEPRELTPRDVFTRDLNLPRSHNRHVVHDRDRAYALRGSESRTLATVGAFRVVSSRDLRDHHDRPADPRSSDVRHLREQGLVETTRIPGSRDYAVSLTKDGRSLIESHR